MNLSEIKKYRNVIIILLVIIIILIMLISLITKNSNRIKESTLIIKEQDPTQIEDIKQALPYIESEYRLSYSETEDLFVVTYPGYKTVDEMEVKTIAWMKQYTDYTNIRVKYGEIGGEIRSYDLSKTTTELLKSNTYVTYDTSSEFGYSN